MYPAVPGPPDAVRAVVTGPTTLLVTWSPPRPHIGTILHYTLYSSRDDQVRWRGKGKGERKKIRQKDPFKEIMLEIRHISLWKTNMVLPCCRWP